MRTQQEVQPTTEDAQDELPNRQLIPNVSPQQLYPSLVAMSSGMHLETSSLISFTRKVINDVEEYQRSTLETSVAGVHRSSKTSPTQDSQNNDANIPTLNTPDIHTQVDTQDETLLLESLPTEDSGKLKIGMQGDETVEPDLIHRKEEHDDNVLSGRNDQESEQESLNHDTDKLTQPTVDRSPIIQDDQTSRASQEDNYHTTIDEDDFDDVVQFRDPVTENILSRNVRIPITEVGCLSFTQMFQMTVPHPYLQIQSVFVLSFWRAKVTPPPQPNGS